MDPWFWACICVGVAGFAIGVNGRIERGKLRIKLAEREQWIEALNSENMDLADENKRYKGTLEALAPPPGAVMETTFHYPELLDAEIDKQIRAAGMRPWGKNGKT